MWINQGYEWFNLDQALEVHAETVNFPIAKAVASFPQPVGSIDLKTNFATLADAASWVRDLVARAI